MNTSRCLYHSSFRTFLETDPRSILGGLGINYHGDILTSTNEAWAGEIAVMQEVLQPWKDEPGHIIFEYDIPRLGKRIDVVLLLRGIIFCLEFKVGQKDALQADVEQVLDYALDLKNFHLLSQDRTIVPILVPTDYKNKSTDFFASVYDDSIYNPLVTGASGLQKLITDILVHAGATTPDETLGAEWIISPYSPTPTIIEAARTLYENHSVENITRHEADKVSTDTTIAYILDVIKKSKANGQKSICFVTGVPGAGKTLVGLDVAVKQSYQDGDMIVDDDGAVYLSGNGPLVAVLTEALAIDNHEKCRARGEKKNLSDSRREVGKFIQIIHRYRDNMLAKIKNPVENGILEIDSEKAMKMAKSGYGEVEHVAIFDEAQRSWSRETRMPFTGSLRTRTTFVHRITLRMQPQRFKFRDWNLITLVYCGMQICAVMEGHCLMNGSISTLMAGLHGARRQEIQTIASSDANICSTHIVSYLLVPVWAWSFACRLVTETQRSEGSRKMRHAFLNSTMGHINISGHLVLRKYENHQCSSSTDRA